MKISEIKRRTIEILSEQTNPISRFELTQLVFKPELDIFQTVITNLIGLGKVDVTVNWQLRLSK